MAVKIYTTSTCQWCKKTKAFLKENKVAFTEVDVGANAKAGEEMIEKSGQSGVPVTIANGKIIVGFDEGKLREALGLK